MCRPSGVVIPDQRGVVKQIVSEWWKKGTRMSTVASGSMVTVITEKLRNQSLDDVKVAPISIPKSTGSTWTFSTSTTSAFTLAGKKNWALFLENCDKWNHMADAGGAVKGSIVSTLEVPPLCPHQRYVQTCGQCDFIPNTPPAPPKKRHCRSLSIPGDDKTGKKWQPQASSIWRPVVQRPHLNNNKMLKNRNCPLGLHKSIPNSSSPVSLGPGPQPHSLTGGYLTLGTGLHISRSEDFVCTPPESPVPRPASASSGFYESSSFSSLNSSWLDRSPSRSSCSSNKFDAFKLRSLSMEEPVSNSISSDANAAGSMPVIAGSAKSTPSSPRRQRVPRCRSQPCVLHDRKCGLKRRRDEERPTLDLLKMKETAYDRFSHRTKSVHFPYPYPSMKSSRSLASLFSKPPECFLGLNTIASSPLDSNLPTHIANNLSTANMEKPTNKNEREGKIADKAPGFFLADNVCSDLDESGDSLMFADMEEEKGCSCNKPGPGSTEEEQMFEIEVNNELDIEQIEKD